MPSRFTARCGGDISQVAASCHGGNNTVDGVDDRSTRRNTTVYSIAGTTVCSQAVPSELQQSEDTIQSHQCLVQGTLGGAHCATPLPAHLCQQAQ